MPEFEFHEVQFFHSPQLAFSPPYTFVFKGYLEMLNNKLTHPCQDFGNQSEVIWGELREQIICAQIFHMDKIGRVNTVFAYTDPDFRGKGLAVRMFKHLEDTVKRRTNPPLKAIYTGAVDENGSIQKVFEKTDRTQYTTRYTKFYG